MATSDTKQSTNAQGDSILTIKGTKYVFRAPTGRDLVAIERIQANDEMTDAERLAHILAQHSKDNLDVDFFLDLPVVIFKELGSSMLNSFRYATD